MFKKFLARIFNRIATPEPQQNKKGIVTFDDECIVRHLADGRTETIRWEDVRKVSVVTTDEGPILDDVFWVITGEGGGCLVPSETLGTKELLIRLQKLPNFRNESFIAAMGSTSRAEFVCWERDGGQA